MSRVAIIPLSVLTLAASLEPAWAQGTPPQPPAGQTPPARARRAPASLQQRVEALEKELAELRAMAVQAPTVAQSVQELTARVNGLEQELGRLSRQQAAAPEVVAALDRLGARLDTAER
ncbi:MAG TPA: hypothetical protein VKZ63_13175, partial [Kofleriaceae bacterium]|nr:hypothetical protein [Kofleriaceae bacterium]